MRIRPTVRLGAFIAGVALIATACGGDGADTGTNGDQGQTGAGVLQDVIDRGTLNCGVNGQVPGFSFLDDAGNWSGFDVEYCRAIAAAVLNDPDAVDFKALTAEQRFTALQSKEIDVLIRNTTWTAGRDGNEGAAFATTTFYDGQGMMVRADSEFQRLEDMQNTTICVLSGTTTELNLESQFRGRNITYTPRSFEDNDTLREAFVAGQCDGWTSDKSQLAGVRSTFPESEGGPEALRILDVTMSKEPLGPVVRDGDTAWFDAVNWIILATIQAEEFGITSSNVDSTAQSTGDAEIKRFLGEPAEAGAQPFDPGLGLPLDFAVRIVKAVGNYAEIYDRTVGPDTPLGLERGVNSLWTQGGLLYAPPYR